MTKNFTANPATGWFHFKLPTGMSFAVRKPRLGDLKRAAQLSGPSTANETYNNLCMGEQLSLLIITEVNEKPMTYEAAMAAGGLEGLFEDLNDCGEVIRIVAELKGGGNAIPLTTTP